MRPSIAISRRITYLECDSDKMFQLHAASKNMSLCKYYFVCLKNTRLISMFLQNVGLTGKKECLRKFDFEKIMQKLIFFLCRLNVLEFVNECRSNISLFLYRIVQLCIHWIKYYPFSALFPMKKKRVTLYSVYMCVQNSFDSFFFILNQLAAYEFVNSIDICCAYFWMLRTHTLDFPSSYVFIIQLTFIYF